MNIINYLYYYLLFIYLWDIDAQANKLDIYTREHFNMLIIFMIYKNTLKIFFEENNSSNQIKFSSFIQDLNIQN